MVYIINEQALKVGTEIEELNIADLNNQIRTIKKPIL